jgi:hypothetical protein
MTKPKFKINKPGERFLIGEKIVVLNDKMSVEDAKLIAEQYPKENYLEFIAPEKPI